MNIYIKLACESATDPKVLAAGPEGFTLWVKGLLYSKQHATEGFVPIEALPLVGVGIAEPATVAARLVSLGLWVEVEGGFTIGAAKWAKWQISNSEIEKKRAEWRERKDRSRKKSEGVTQSSRDTSRKSSRDSHADVSQLDNRQQTTDISSLREDPPKPPADVALVPDDAAAVIEYFNSVTGRNLTVKAHSQFAARRLKLGATVDDLRLVIDYKSADWLGDPEWERHLFPETIFRPSKFEKNLVNAREWDARGRAPLSRGTNGLFPESLADADRRLASAGH